PAHDPARAVVAWPGGAGRGGRHRRGARRLAGRAVLAPRDRGARGRAALPEVRPAAAWAAGESRSAAGADAREAEGHPGRQARLRPGQGRLHRQPAVADVTTAAARAIRAPRGIEISCKGWPQEAALRMLMNNLDPEVAERPQDLVVYGGTGRAARSWEAFHQIVRALRSLRDDETLLIQSGKPVGVFRTQPLAPRVLISNSMLVPKWADWETFWELERAGLTMYGQMTAGSWIYIGSQGILQGTYETLGELAAKRWGGSLNGRT